MDFNIIIAAVGATFILTKSKLIRPFREWFGGKSIKRAEFIQCCQCQGFWFGILFSLPILITSLAYQNFFIVLYNACIVSFISYISDIILDKIKKY